MTELRIILCTCEDREQAEDIARRLVDGQLAACVNIVPGVSSVYRWKGELETSGEVLLLIKTGAAQIGRIEDLIAIHHPYELPEFLVIDIAGGSERYLAWLSANLK